MNVQKILDSLHNLERKVLPALKPGIELNAIINITGLKEVEVMRAVQWLENKKIITTSQTLRKEIELDANGKKYLTNGLPEKIFLKNLTKEEEIEKIQKKTRLGKEEINVCIGLLRKKSAIFILPTKKIKITEHGEMLKKKSMPEEQFLRKLPIDFELLSPEEKEVYEELKKRKQIIRTKLIKIKKIDLTELGEELIKHNIDKKYIDVLTPQILKEGVWRNKEFRRYDIKINVPRIYGGKKHFVNQAIDYIKRIWLDLGFKEMKGNIIQTSFWNLDSLFIPQDHPARAMQDTFYIGEKNFLLGELPKNYRETKKVHENGGKTKSIGWQSPWSEEEAKKVLLRTHTTVLSAQTISRLNKNDLPAKFFSVGKVFRNEALDWKHLFEFNQVEGIVVDPNANLKHLKGYLREFFGKMGYIDIRMRPSHFPYTEPSMEVDVLHPKKNVWIELGGAGIFRPEVVVPLLGEDIPVLAWGLGMPRIISGYFEITDIRDLYKNDLKQIREMKMWMK